MRYTGDASSDPNSCIPKGEYLMTCTAVQDKDRFDNPLKSKNGNNMWILEMTVCDGPQENRKAWHYLVFLPPGAAGHGMTLKTLKGFGYDANGDNEILPEHLRGRTVKVDLDIDPGDGSFEPKNVIKKWHTPPGDLEKFGAWQGQGDAQAGPADGRAADQGDASFDSKKLEQESVPAGQPAGGKQPAHSAPKAAEAPAQPKKKPLWGAGR